MIPLLVIHLPAASTENIPVGTCRAPQLLQEARICSQTCLVAAQSTMCWCSKCRVPPGSWLSMCTRLSMHQETTTGSGLELQAAAYPLHMQTICRVSEPRCASVGFNVICASLTSQTISHVSEARCSCVKCHVVWSSLTSLSINDAGDQPPGAAGYAAGNRPEAGHAGAPLHGHPSYVIATTPRHSPPPVDICN